MKRADRELALKAYRLFKKNIRGEELAHRLKVASASIAYDLAAKGKAILSIEAQQLTRREWEVMATLVRVIARTVDRGDGPAAVWLSEVDFAAGQSGGWCTRTIAKRLSVRSDRPAESYFGFIVNNNGRLKLTDAGWAFAWATGLILPNWKVPA